MNDLVVAAKLVVSLSFLGLAYSVLFLIWLRFVELEWRKFMAVWRSKTDKAKALAERDPSLEGLNQALALLDESEQYGHLANLLMYEGGCKNPISWVRVWWGRFIGRPSRLDAFHHASTLSFRPLTQAERDYATTLIPSANEVLDRANWVRRN